MNRRIYLRKAGCAFATLCICAGLSAQAATINATYSLTGTASGDPTNPPLIGNATGSLLPFGSLVWQDMLVPDLSTGSGDGTFIMTFASGDTLFGLLHEQGDFSFPPTATPFAQTLKVTGGTGAFLLYHGTLTGTLISDLTMGTFTSSGSGTLETTPEPASIALLSMGLLCIVAYKKRTLLFRFA